LPEARDSCARHGSCYTSGMGFILGKTSIASRRCAFRAWIIAALCMGSCGTQAASGVSTARSYEIPISRHEMLQSPGALRPEAAESLRHMAAMARERNAELRVQVPADMASSVGLIRAVAPAARVLMVSARQPYKLVVATGTRSTSASTYDTPRGSAQANDGQPLVVIHLRDEIQDPIAERCAQRLERAGARVADTRVLVPVGPRTTQLRYFHPQDRREAAELAQALNAIGMRIALLDLSRDYRNTLPTHRYELWLAPG
jgi:hypothetical protein